MLSIRRDAVVDVPGKVPRKISDTPAGGVPPVVSRVESLTGPRVDHILVVDFASLAEVTEVLGGVTVANPAVVTDPRTRKTFAEGRLVPKGEEAVTWARQRPTGRPDDLDRVPDQQRLPGATGQKIDSIGVTGNPVLLENVVDTIASNLTVDATLTLDRLSTLLTDLLSTPTTRPRSPPRRCSPPPRPPRPAPR